MSNLFLDAVYKYDTYTENGAISHSTTGSELVNYFAKCGTFRDRYLKQVFADMNAIWYASPKIALQIIFYNRLISRKTKGFLNSEKVQRGQGNRSEFRSSITWLARYQPETLYKNLWLIPIVGSWKDLWHEDLLNELDRSAVYNLVLKGINDDYNKDLLAKLLPRIRSKSNTKNERHQALNKFAFGLLKVLKWTPTQYRKFKSSGKAHEFQQKMCDNQWGHLDFNKIPGQALFMLVNNEGRYDKKTTLKRHDLEKRYIEWIKEQPTAKFTGYVYKLMGKVSPKMSLAQKITLDKQFDGLIELAKQDDTEGKGFKENIWCALDTSGSMRCAVADTTAYDVCVSLGIYFSALNEGAFKDQVIMFDSTSKVKKLKGSFTSKVQQLSKTSAMGSTNFQSVIKEIVRIRTKNPTIPIEDYPTTLLIVSDMQFNATGTPQTNYEAAMQKLAEVGLPKIRIIWWWVIGRGTDFPSNMDEEGVVMLGGFDGAIISLFMDGEERAINEKPRMNLYEAMLKTLNQEILTKICI